MARRELVICPHAHSSLATTFTVPVSGQGPAICHVHMGVPLPFPTQPHHDSVCRGCRSCPCPDSIHVAISLSTLPPREPPKYFWACQPEVHSPNHSQRVTLALRTRHSLCVPSGWEPLLQAWLSSLTLPSCSHHLPFLRHVTNVCHILKLVHDLETSCWLVPHQSPQVWPFLTFQIRGMSPPGHFI